MHNFIFKDDDDDLIKEHDKKFKVLTDNFLHDVYCFRGTWYDFILKEFWIFSSHARILILICVVTFITTNYFPPFHFIILIPIYKIG